MYSLKVILVGCTEAVLPSVRRELGNLGAVVDGEYPDVRSALAQLPRKTDEQRLVVVQPKSAADIKPLERLNELLVGQPILALVDPSHDAALLLRAMRAGAAQVVRVPVVADDFKAALQRIAIQFGHLPRNSRLIAVAGAVEGCGATTIAINLAAEIAQLKNAPCILTEGSLRLGRLANHLGIEPRVTWYDLLREPERLDIEVVRQAMTQVADHLQVLSGSHQAVTPVPVTAEDVSRINGYLSQLAEVVVMDMPYVYDEIYFGVMASAQELVLVTEQKVASIHGIKLLRDSLEAKGCLATQYVVINRYSPTFDEFSAKRLKELLRVPEVLTIANDYLNVRTAENHGRLLRQEAPRSQALADIRTLARRLLGMSEPARHERSWRQWLRRLVGSNGLS